MEAMDPNQSDRYATYRRIRLKREIVRRLVNQTLSQSVPQPVIIAVTSYSKGFIGEIIEDQAVQGFDVHYTLDRNPFFAMGCREPCSGPFGWDKEGRVAHLKSRATDQDFDSARA